MMRNQKRSEEWKNTKDPCESWPECKPFSNATPMKRFDRTKVLWDMKCTHPIVHQYHTATMSKSESELRRTCESSNWFFVYSMAACIDAWLTGLPHGAAILYFSVTHSCQITALMAMVGVCMHNCIRNIRSSYIRDNWRQPNETILN